MSAHINKLFASNAKNLLGIILYNPTHLHIHLSKNVKTSVERLADSVYATRYLLYAKINGDDRARTGNLRLAKPALSQLSYVPGTNWIY
jgi:hypothetical protein